MRDFLVDLFEVADPSRRRGGSDHRARDPRRRRRGGSSASSPASPRSRAELLDAIARVERSLGLVARPRARGRARARAARSAALGAEAPATAASRVTLGEVLVDAGDFDAARGQLSRAPRPAPGMTSRSSAAAPRRW